MAEGSGEGRVGLDEAGVEEVRRIMYVAAVLIQATWRSVWVWDHRSTFMCYTDVAGRSRNAPLIRHG
jgi:hypothetical protein